MKSQDKLQNHHFYLRYIIKFFIYKNNFVVILVGNLFIRVNHKTISKLHIYTPDVIMKKVKSVAS